MELAPGLLGPEDGAFGSLKRSGNAIGSTSCICSGQMTTSGHLALHPFYCITPPAWALAVKGPAASGLPSQRLLGSDARLSG